MKSSVSRRDRFSLACLMMALAQAALAATTAAADPLTVDESQSEARRARSMLAMTAYHHGLGDAYGDWEGLAARYTRTDGVPTTAVLDLVLEKRDEGSGSFMSAAAYQDISRDLYAFAVLGFGSGERFFVSNKQYAQLSYKVPFYPGLVLSSGLGRNDYGPTWDLESGAGLALYVGRAVAQYTWLHFENFHEKLGSNSHLAQIGVRDLGPVDLSMQFLAGKDGYRIASGEENTAGLRFESKTVALEGTLWLFRDARGLKARYEYGEKEGFYERNGLEVGVIVGF